MIKRTSSIPMYLQISDYLKKQIIEGVIEEGNKISTEIELMEQFKVSRTTVRLAMKEVMKNNLVERRPGKGTFVTTGKVYHHLEGFKGLYETLLETGITPETKLLDYKHVRITDHIKKAFELKEDMNGLQVIRLYHMDMRPIALTQITLHPNVSNLISKEESIKFPIYKLLGEKTGCKVKQAHFEIFSENASKYIADCLQIKEHDAVLGAERILYTEEGVPLEHTFLWFRADAYRFTLSLKEGTKIELADSRQFRLTINNKGEEKQ